MKLIKMLIYILGVFGLIPCLGQIKKPLTIKMEFQNLPDNEKVYFTKYKQGGFGDTLSTGISKNGYIIMKCNIDLSDDGEFYFIKNNDNRLTLFLDTYTQNIVTIKVNYRDWKILDRINQPSLTDVNGSKSHDTYAMMASVLAKSRNESSKVRRTPQQVLEMDSLAKLSYYRATDSISNIYYKIWYNQIFKHPDHTFSAVLIQNGSFLTLEEKVKAFKHLTERVKASKYGKVAAQQITEMKAKGNDLTPQEKAKMVRFGKIIPDFSLKKPDGKYYSLQEAISGNKLLFIDFWASWCKPCRAENPNIKKVYDAYNKKGLNILSVSLDSDHMAWRKAIEKDQLNWSHVSDLKGWKSDAAIIFNLGSIPKSILVDNEGRIIAMDLRGEELSKKIEKILGNNNP